MSSSIAEAVAEAIAELELKDWVVNATEDISVAEDKPGNMLRKRLNVMHQTSQGGYTYSGKEFYIDKATFNYYWHYGGGTMEEIATPFKDFLLTYVGAAKSYYGFETIDIIETNEIDENGIVKGYKPTIGDNADTYTLKVWKIDATTLGHKVIDIVSVS